MNSTERNLVLSLLEKPDIVVDIAVTPLESENTMALEDIVGK